MSTPQNILDACKKRKRILKIYGFHTFADLGYPIDPEGPFRDNIQFFLQQCGEINDYTIDGMPIWGYIVLHRPWAFVQWLEQANIEEDYILMAEPDHIIVKPIPNLSRDGLATAFPFFYIEPEKEESVLRKFFSTEKGPITNIDPIGNSPVIIAKRRIPTVITWNHNGKQVAIEGSWDNWKTQGIQKK